MWVFDGEQWILDDGSDGFATPKSEQAQQQPRWHELVPELQVVEIVPVPVKNTIIPVMPLPQKQK